MTTRDRIHARHCRDPLCDAAGDAEPGDDCKNLDCLLDQVEDDRVHAEADKQRLRAKEVLRNAGADRRTAELMAGVINAVAVGMDPYELKDNVLTRKSDGKVMRCEKCP
jgi:hypothetical protein